MKTSIAIIIGSLVLSISIIFCTLKITSQKVIPAQFPSSFSVTTYDGENKLKGSNDFMSLYEASAYLKVDHAKLVELINKGKFKGTYTSYSNNGSTTYIFLASKLYEEIKEVIENGETIK